MNIKLIKRIIIFFLAVLSALSVLQGCRNAIEYSQDFQYDATKVLMVGLNPYDESLNPSEALKSLGLEEYFKQMEANQFPSLLFLLLPYTYLKPLVARYAWMVSNLLFTVLIVYFLKKTFFKNYSKEDFIIVSLLLVAGTPWRNQIGVGQHTLFSLMFFLLSIYIDEYRLLKNKTANMILSALALSVSYFKYTLTVPLGLYFIYKKKYKELFISVIPHLILTAVAAVWLKDSFINMLLKPLKVANALTSEGSMDIGSMLGGGYATMGLTVVLLLLILFIVIKLPKGNEAILISMLTMWSLIITYHRIYDHFVLIIPLSMFTGICLQQDKIKNLCLLLLLVLIGMDFFVMRIFSADGDVIIPVIVLYYIYTLIVTIGTCKAIKLKKDF